MMREGDADPGRAKVKVIQTGEVLTVDDDDLEKVSYIFKVITVTHNVYLVKSRSASCTKESHFIYMSQIKLSRC